MKPFLLSADIPNVPENFFGPKAGEKAADAVAESDGETSSIKRGIYQIGAVKNEKRNL